MGGRTSGNKNNNKVVYGKRHEGKSSGAQLVKAGGLTFPAVAEVAVTFLPLWAGGCDGRCGSQHSLLQSSLTHQIQSSRLEQSN